MEWPQKKLFEERSDEFFFCNEMKQYFQEFIYSLDSPPEADKFATGYCPVLDTGYQEES